MDQQRVNELKKDFSLPCAVYYFYLNEEFKKVYTMDDIEKPGKEAYDFRMQDYMTLGRPMPEYEDWAKGCMEMDLKRKQSKSECKVSLGKFGITSFDDIETFFSENCDNLSFLHFDDVRLNEYFEISNN